MASCCARLYASLIALTLSCASVGAAEPQQTPSAAHPATPAAQALRAESEVWRRRMARTPRPRKGCFVTTYPQATWQQVQCAAAPQLPLLPRKGGGARLETVGAGTDFSSRTAGDTLTAEGSFTSVTGVTSESGGGAANNYTLQLNTEFFSTTACSGGLSGCQGWEQFIYYNDPPSTSFAFIQYWLINYGSTCPGGWTFYQGSCYTNSAEGVIVPNQTIATLGEMTLTGVAPAGSSGDSVTLSIGNTLYSVTGNSYFPDLAQHWNTSEFNIFGPGNSSQAAFNTGSTVVIRTAMDNGTAAPSCVLEGFTAETNNLTLTGTPTAESGASWPSIVFTQTNAGTPTGATCATTGVDLVAATATTIKSGSATKLTVTPTGSGPFTYQWYAGVAGNTSTPVPGGTGSSLTVSPGSTSSYWALVTGPGGLVQYSQTTTITVVAASSADAPLPLWSLVALGAALLALVNRDRALSRARG